MRTIIAALTALLLAGCAGLTDPTVVANGPRFIIINDPVGLGNTMGMAQNYCSKGGMNAVFRGNTTQPEMVCYNKTCQYFECVH